MRQIVQVDEAVLRIGRKLIGEVALTMSALSKLTPSLLPWMDVTLAWKRSMAAGLVLESLVAAGGHQAIESNLMTSALMHPLGRIILGTMFPRHYKNMLEICTRSEEALADHEQHTFPIRTTEAVAHLFDRWQLPSDVYLPLRFAAEDYSSLARLPEPMRTKAELVKVSVELAHLVVNRWERWDLVEFPPASVLTRLAVENAEEIIARTKVHVRALADFHPHKQPLRHENPPTAELYEVPYCNLTDKCPDFVPQFLESVGIKAIKCSRIELCALKQASVASRIGNDLDSNDFHGLGENVVIITNDATSSDATRSLRTVNVPNSYARLHSALLACIRPASAASERSHSNGSGALQVV
jgi:hypothetical protein